MKHAVVLLLAFLSLCSLPAGASVKKDIAAKTRELQDLQQSIKEKRAEKERCMLQEKCVRVELAEIEKAFDRLQKEREKLRRSIVKAEKNLVAAGRALKAAGRERQQRAVALCSGVEACGRQTATFPRLFPDPAQDRAWYDAVHGQKTSLTTARQKEAASQQALARWQSAEKALMALKARQEATAAEQEALRNQKKEFLKTTIGRRIVAEEDIKRLQESTRALQQLIVKLERARKRSDDEAGRKRTMQGKKRSLPWPVSGKVLTPYGKSKHAELDTYVISNGIKIQGRRGAGVTAVEKGVVMFAGTFRSYGLMVIVDHGGGFCSIYGQLGTVAVEEDQAVAAGGTIGTIATKGDPVLYFEIRSEGQAEDPLLWLEGRNQ